MYAQEKLAPKLREQFDKLEMLCGVHDVKMCWLEGGADDEHGDRVNIGFWEYAKELKAEREREEQEEGEEEEQ